jgi:hypothetical protein
MQLVFLLAEIMDSPPFIFVHHAFEDQAEAQAEAQVLSERIDNQLVVRACEFTPKESEDI